MNNQVIDFTDAKKLRKKAEKQLTDKHLTKKQLTEKQNLENNTLMEALLHELQIHQIELEMQNEELRQAYETVETVKNKYTRLFDLSPLGYFSLDSEGTICDLNFTGADMLGEKRANLIDSNFKLFISEESKLVFGNFLKKVYNSNGKKSCELSLRYNNKPLGRVYMEGLVTDDEQQKCLISGVDISKL